MAPERAFLTDVLVQHGGASSIATQYVMAQVSAGLVPLPDFRAAEVAT